MGTTRKTRKAPAKPKAATRPAPAKAGATLDDLDPKAREQLLAEARGRIEADTGVADEAEQIVAAARDEQIAALLDARDHMRKCPGGRVEMYSATRPADPANATPKTPVTVVRCVECGGSTILEQPYELTVSEIEERELDHIETGGDA